MAASSEETKEKHKASLDIASRMKENLEKAFITFKDILKLSVSKLRENKMLRIRITYVVNPNDFYVRPDYLTHYLKVIERPESEDEYIPEPDSTVLYKSRLLTWIRGKVISVDKKNKTYEVYAMDYGFIDKTTHPLKLNEMSAKVPSLVVRCTTRQCYPPVEAWNRNAVAAFKRTVEQKTYRVVNHGGSNNVILHIEFISPENVSLLLAGYTVSDSINIQAPRIYKPRQYYFTYNTVAVGQTLHVKFLHGNANGFHVAQIDKYNKYRSVMEKLANITDNMKCLDTEDLMECFPVWYRNKNGNCVLRAYIVQVMVPGKKVKIYLVDYGQYIDVLRVQIFRMDELYLRMSPLYTFCTTDTNKKCWKLFYSGAEFDITVKDGAGDGIRQPLLVTITENSSTV